MRYFTNLHEIWYCRVFRRKSLSLECHCLVERIKYGLDQGCFCSQVHCTKFEMKIPFCHYYFRTNSRNSFRFFWNCSERERECAILAPSDNLWLSLESLRGRLSSSLLWGSTSLQPISWARSPNTALILLLSELSAMFGFKIGWTCLMSI